MSVHTVLGRNVIWWDERSRKHYWTKLSIYIIQKYKTIDNSDKEFLVSLYKDCFQFLVNEFKAILDKENNITLYAFAYGFHDTSIEIWQEQIKKKSIDPFDKRDFAMYRRVLKIIIEQACDKNLFVGVDIREDMYKNRIENKAKLEDLLYLGTWIFGFAEHIAHFDLMGLIHGMRIENESTISILTNQPFPFLMDVMQQDYEMHLSSVVIDVAGVSDLKAALENSLKIEFNKMVSFIGEQSQNPTLKFALIKIDELKNKISELFGFNPHSVNDFFHGLTLNKVNKPSIEESILNPQKINRYIYRPVLELETNMGKVALVGLNKWSESLTTLTTNAIPWGVAPDEWLKYDSFRNYVISRNNAHDEILEDAAENILIKNEIVYERNIVSFKISNGEYIRCDIPNVGEIDFIFFDPFRKTICVMECKHNRSRFDMISWRKEYSNFINDYETKLSNKVKWVIRNLKSIEQHFKLKNMDAKLDLSQYEVEGVFLLNAPNFYLYNGNFHSFTLFTLQQLVTDTYVNTQYEITLKGEGDDSNTFITKRPLFINTIKQINKIKK